MHKLRIIGGEWRGRKIPVHDQPQLRPTPDRVRETLFNWINLQVQNSHCLDLFAGTGALGIEAASRGAAQVWLIEKDPFLCQSLRQISFAASKLKLMQTDALHWLRQPPPQAFDLVFLDPPFALNLLPSCCTLLTQQAWLTPQASVYLEMPSSTPLDWLPQNWRVRRQLKAGQVQSVLIDTFPDSKNHFS